MVTEENGERKEKGNFVSSEVKVQKKLIECR